LLIGSLLLVFFGTLDQVELGVRGAQIKYFESFIAAWGYPASWPFGETLRAVYIPIPGGYLLGPLLVLNLACAHFRHFHPKWSNGGIVLIHLGILLLIFSQLFTQLFQEEDYIWFEEGETVNALTSFNRDELVLIETSEADYDTVVSIPAEMLRPGDPLSPETLPFTVEVLHFYRNAEIVRSHPHGGAPVANRGLAAEQGLEARALAPTFKGRERNASTAYVRLRAGDEILGTWLVSTLFDAEARPQRFQWKDRTFQMALRFKEKPLPFRMTLLDFTHDRYPGTNIPHNFSSHIRLQKSGTGEDREVLIYMNHPLRYEGLTFYQSAFGQDSMGRADRASRLQVVRNPGWLGPYLACTLVSLGLCWQFGWVLLRFIKRRKSQVAQERGASPGTMPAGRSGLGTWSLFGLLVVVGISVLYKPFIAGPAGDETLAPFNLEGFGHLPVLDGGRVKPLDTLARNSLILTRAKQTALDAEGEKVPAIRVLADLLFDSEAAAEYKMFRLDNPDLLDLVEQPGDTTTHLSYEALRPFLQRIDAQAREVPEEAAERSPYQSALLKLHRAILRYQSLEFGLLPRMGPAERSLTEFLDSMMDPSTESPNRDPASMAAFLRQQSGNSGLLLVPQPRAPDRASSELEWTSPSHRLLLASVEGEADPVLRAYFELSDAWREKDAVAFDASLDRLQSLVAERAPEFARQVSSEYAFNQFQPFYLSLQLYLIAFFAVSLAWLLQAPLLGRLAVWTAVLALFIHSAGLAFRVYLSGYAPVTNLYSSSVFVGWGAVLMALPMERIFRNGLATAAASLTGFTTLVVAHNLAMAGGSDTMEMMRAVLDSNFWLSTHVTTITIGYSATFLAGALGILYIILSWTPGGPSKDMAASLRRMVYGIICFALLFSFVGTILGGIWADQSWGRFWGWDPKENGALMIVLWNALILHGLRTSMIDTPRLMCFAVGGNIVTSWSWFGTNMLGVGLHSYGFMDKAFLWLVVFWISQLAFILLGARRRIEIQGASLDSGS
jgi:ABC-type transport system involved in cytochrome c biogenesis permease subunit